MSAVIEQAVDPAHYKNRQIAGRELIELTHRMSFSAGNCLKYVHRAGHKVGQSAEQDLAKALRYLEFLIKNHESAWVHGRPPLWFEEWRRDALHEGGSDLLIDTVTLLHFGLYRQAHLELTDYIKENFPA